MWAKLALHHYLTVLVLSGQKDRKYKIYLVVSFLFFKEIEKCLWKPSITFLRKSKLSEMGISKLYSSHHYVIKKLSK